MRKRIPEVLYFPTFLFNQPERIYLRTHEGETPSNRIYRQIIENIASGLDRPLDVERHLVDRMISEETVVDGVYSAIGLSKNKQQQITAAKNEISRNLTAEVFKSGTKTFGGDFGGREIIINLEVDTEQFVTPEVYAFFEIKDDGGQYEIRERSLGFRWFFSFILFTVFGSKNGTDKNTLFLFDEPAANLHSRAQMQLLESFRRITDRGNQIIYSTHSHYMINPDWLDQAFIVANAAIDYGKAYQNDNVEANTRIWLERYRTFVGQNPDKVTYFQPVLDKLDVVPSRFDVLKKSVLLEGKGDYRIVEYVQSVISKIDRAYALVPTRGATGMQELLGIFLGWSVDFVICLDDDKEGRRAREVYRSEWGLPDERVFTLGDLSGSYKNCRIEGLLDAADIALISKHYGVDKPTKGQIGLYFSEMLSTRTEVEISEKLKDFADLLHKRVSAVLS